MSFDIFLIFNVLRGRVNEKFNSTVTENDRNFHCLFQLPVGE